MGDIHLSVSVTGTLVGQFYSSDFSEKREYMFPYICDLSASAGSVTTGGLSFNLLSLLNIKSEFKIISYADAAVNK